MESKNDRVFRNMELGIKQEDDWQNGTASELNPGLTLELVPVWRIKEEADSEENEAWQDLLSQSSRLTSKGASQVGCTSLTHSDLGGHCQMGEVSDFRIARVFADTTPAQCNICEKSFIDKWHLERHILLHSDTRPYQCDRCEKSFTQKYYLDRHIVAHSDTRPYQCDICKKCFKQKSHLNRHILTHSYIRPYKCDRCEKSFTDKWHLERHIPVHGRH